MRASSGGASIVFGSRSYFWISYGTPSSSSSQRTRCERELLRWWTVSIGTLRRLPRRAHCRRPRARGLPRASSHHVETTMDNDDVVKTLNKLIETCKDGEYGFRACAEHVKSAQLKTVFLERAESCRRGAAELQEVVVRCGGEAEDDSSTTGTLHRGWV